jgi:hypothetical protein
MRREDMNDENNMDDCVLSVYRMCGRRNTLGAAAAAAANTTPDATGSEPGECG